MDESFTREEHLPNRIDEVWEALTDAAGLAAWLGRPLVADPRPGGELEVGAPGDEDKRTGFFEEIDHDEHRLSFWWRRGEDDPTRVEVELAEEEDGTRLTVVESRPLAALDAGSTLLETWSAGTQGPQMRAPAALVG